MHATDALLELDPTLTADTAAELLELAHRHRLRYEIWPERRVYAGRVRQVGFELDLIGDHYQPAHPPLPGCEECRSVYRALERIADFVIIKPERESRFEIRGFDGSLRYSREAPRAGAVTYTIQIVHRRAPHSAPPDGCERRCLAEMEAKLLALGARAEARHLGDDAA